MEIILILSTERENNFLKHDNLSTDEPYVS